MWIRRSLGALSALSIALAGCASNADSPGDAPPVTSAAPAPREELAAAAGKLNETTMTIALTSPGTQSNGSLDPRRKLGDLDMRVSAGGREVTIQIRTVGKDAYVQADGLPGIAPGKWLEIEGSRLAGSTLDVFPEDDPSGANRLVDALSDIKQDGPGRFSATIDLTKASPNKSLAALGDKVKALPFVATVDDRGRLTHTEIDMTSVDPAAGRTTATYSDFGTPVTVERPPPGQTMPAPEEVVRMLTANGA
jgi:hypothetical protein